MANIEHLGSSPLLLSGESDAGTGASCQDSDINVSSPSEAVESSSSSTGEPEADTGAICQDCYNGFSLLSELAERDINSTKPGEIVLRQDEVFEKTEIEEELHLEVDQVIPCKRPKLEDEVVLNDQKRSEVCLFTGVGNENCTNEKLPDTSGKVRIEEELYLEIDQMVPCKRLKLEDDAILNDFYANQKGSEVCLITEVGNGHCINESLQNVSVTTDDPTEEGVKYGAAEVRYGEVTDQPEVAVPQDSFQRNEQDLNGDKVEETAEEDDDSKVNGSSNIKASMDDHIPGEIKLLCQAEEMTIDDEGNRGSVTIHTEALLGDQTPDKMRLPCKAEEKDVQDESKNQNGTSCIKASSHDHILNEMKIAYKAEEKAVDDGSRKDSGSSYLVDTPRDDRIPVEMKIAYNVEEKAVDDGSREDNGTSYLIDTPRDDCIPNEMKPTCKSEETVKADENAKRNAGSSYLIEASMEDNIPGEMVVQYKLVNNECDAVDVMHMSSDKLENDGSEERHVTQSEEQLVPSTDSEEQAEMEETESFYEGRQRMKYLQGLQIILYFI
jgi:hypothetical protein